MRWAVACLGIAACSLALAADPPPKHFGRDRDVDIEHLKLELSIDIPKERVEGAAELTVRGIVASASSATFDAVRLDVARVSVDGRAAAHDADGKSLRVTLDPPLLRDEARTIRVEYSVTRPRNGMYFVHGPGAHRERDEAWSQGETEENRSWFPVHDAPTERLTSESLITVAEPLQVVGNGRLLSVTPAGPGRRTFHHRLDFPHVPYLVSVAVGDWARRTAEWEGVELTYQAPKAREADMDRTFAGTPRIMAFLSSETGVKYPFPVYHQTCVSEFIHGGMENITATTLTDQTLHDARAEPDWRSDSLVAHELAHQWFGDYVTCKSWSDSWLNEGFATYYAALAMGDLFGDDQLAVEMDGMRQGAVSADKGDRRRPIVTNRWNAELELFDGHAYSKGGMVLHALRRELGGDAYRASIQQWLTRHGGRSASTHELEAVVEDVTGRSVSRFFDQWLYNPGQPDLKARWKWKEGDCAITVTQAQVTGDGDEGAFDVPLDLQVLGDGIVIDRAVRIDSTEQTFHVPCATRPEAVLVDPQGWLIRTLDIDREDDEAAWVLAHAKLLLPRLEAARDLKDRAGMAGNLDALREAALHASEWPLRKEAAAALELGGPDATPVLLEALAGETDSRVRAAAAGALGRHRGEGVRAALEKALAGDASYAVRAAAARALGKMRDPAASRALEQATAQRSHREEVLAGSLEGLAELRAPRLRGIAERLAAPAQPYAIRARAIAALGRVAKDSLVEADRRAIVEGLERMLDDGSYRVRIAAQEALVSAAHADGLDELRRVAASHPHELTRSRAEGAVQSLVAALAEGTTTSELRRALEDERKKREELEARVRKLEARPAGPDREAAAEGSK